MPREIEIIPPQRTAIAKPQSVVITTHVPGIRGYGPIEAYFAENRYARTSRVVDTLTTLNHSEAKLFNAQTVVALNKLKLDDTLFLLQEAPERRGHELAVRRSIRGNELRDLQHHSEMNEQRRRKEYTLSEAEYVHAKATLTHARTVLIDAEQQLRAQEKFGGATHELNHKKKIIELLEVELETKERRLLLQRHGIDLEDEENTQDQIYRARAEAIADGEEAAIDEQVEELFAKRRAK